MTDLFKKLNFKNQQEIYIINAPTSFADEQTAIAPFTKVRTKISAKTVNFAIAFVTHLKEVEHFIHKCDPLLENDAVLWLCYPKGSSKKYSCDFNRDTGFKSLGELDWEPVRIVSIDQDWSALRFRRVSFIKNITRKEDFALTKEAKARTTQRR